MTRSFYTLQNLVEGKIFHEAVGRCLVAFQKAVVYCIGLNVVSLYFEEYIFTCVVSEAKYVNPPLDDQ